MYSTCLFCNADLGRNEVIERFPIGRRLAFDAAKGRLWVVCRKCERWNLTPLEERWEAIEDAERLFADTRLRVSTDNIGLARLTEGLVLVRIGSALRPEMAAWRYGDQFGRRRRRHLALSAAGIALVGGIVIAGPGMGIIAGGGWGLWQGANGLHDLYQNRRVRVRLRLPDSERIAPIRRKQLEHTSLIRVEHDWALHVSMRKPRPGHEVTSDIPRVLVYTGAQALQAASKILPAVNETGAKTAEVRSAVQLVTDAGDPGQLFRCYAATPQGSDPSRNLYRRANALFSLPKEVRLALEMASHEEQERRAMEGELALLEAAWREADEVARIADDMFVPDTARARLEELREKD